MKPSGTVLCFLILLSCGKDRNDSQVPDGSWELRKIEYGYSVQPVITYPAGNGNVITFTGSNRYTRTDITGNDTITSSGSYTISGGTTCNGQSVPVISFSGGYQGTSLFRISGDSLYFSSDSCVITDGYKRTYTKINN